MDTIHVRAATLADIEELQKIGKETFSESFAMHNTEENMAKYLEEKFSIENLTTELKTHTSAFFFATLAERIIGYLKVNFGKSQTELRESNGLEIERIYVLKEFHGKKVGQVLYDKAIAFAHEIKAGYIWLGVWEENARAIAFYKKNGFIQFDQHVFTLGSDEQIDIMMKKELP